MYSKMVLAEVDKLWSSTQLLAHQKTVTQADAGLGCKLSGGFPQDSRKACPQIMLFTLQNRMVEVVAVIMLNVFNFRIS